MLYSIFAINPKDILIEFNYSKLEGTQLRIAGLIQAQFTTSLMKTLFDDFLCSLVAV
jgi:hypothetical protein